MERHSTLLLRTSGTERGERFPFNGEGVIDAATFSGEGLDRLMGAGIGDDELITSCLGMAEGRFPTCGRSPHALETTLAFYPASSDVTKTQPVLRWSGWSTVPAVRTS